MIRIMICSIIAILLAGFFRGRFRYPTVVTGLDANNKAVVQFDSRMTLAPGQYGLNSTNLWVTNIIRSAFRSRTIPRRYRSAFSPLDNGTKFRVVEFPPLDAATEAKMDPNYLMKAVGDRAPRGA